MVPEVADTPVAAARVVGSGSDVVLIHGWGSRGDLWGPIVDCLAHSHRVTVVDLPGFGGTAPPPTAWGVDDYANWLANLLDQRGIGRASLVGHSFGGSVAAVIAVRSPERVYRLVLTDSAGIRAPQRWSVRWRVRVYRMLRRLAAQPGVPASVQAWARRRAEARGSVDYRAAIGTMRASFVRIVNEDLRDRFAKIRVPVLLVWGERDQDTPLSDARLMERLIPDAGLVVFPGAGHFAYAEQPQRFCRVVTVFLADEGGA